MTADDKRVPKRHAFSVLIKESIDAQQNGDFAGAEKKCLAALELNPKNPEAIHLLGVLHHQSGRNKTALFHLSRAIKIDPLNPYFYNNFGTALKRNGQLGKAKNCFLKAMQLKPDYFEAIYNLAGIYVIETRYEEALRHYQRALRVNNASPETLNNMAATFNLMGNFDKALDCCRQAVRLNQENREALNNMGNAYIGLGNPEAAIACYEKSMQFEGESADVLCNLGNAFQEKGDIDIAISTYNKAIQIDSSYGKAYNNLGTACQAKGRTQEAGRLFKKAIELLPNDAEAYHNMGNLCYEAGALNTAKTWFEKALSIEPGKVPTIINSGIIAQEIRESDKALAFFSKALDIQPQNSKALCHITHELYQRCEWGRIDELNETLDRCTQSELATGSVPAEMPFLSLIRTPDPKKNFQVAKRWSQRIGQRTVRPKANEVYARKSKNEKIIIGYLSNNFRNHPTAHLTIDIFGLHDRDRFDINVYSYGEDDGSQYRKTIASNSDRFVDLRGMSHEQAANRIRMDRVDILIDLVGYMHGHRLEISACRPAPLQVRWLGLAGTTGAHFYDYLITDPIVTPEREAQWYSEKFVYLPDTYQVNSRPINEPEFQTNRKALGLPEKGFIFCCFCSNYKIEPVMFRVWMKIISSVQDSVLWVLKSSTIVEKNLKREAQQNGVDPKRLIFAEKISKESHLQRIRIADLALDTRVVNGAATTSDALYAGVPVLSLKGTHFASRMSASILNAIGLGELVCESLNSYEDKAIHLGKNPSISIGLKKRLKQNRITKPLFDTPRFIKHLERGYFAMWDRYQGGKPPGIIHVTSFR